jgi:aspartate aminotransferase-like enzyme
MRHRRALAAYPAYLFDVDGTLAYPERAVPGAPEALAALKAHGRSVLAVTNNSSLGRHEIAERFRRGCVDEVGLELVAANPTAACTAASLPEDVVLADLQGALFAALRMVIASGSTPDGATTLQFGHGGWLFHADVDEAVRVLTAAVRAARGGKAVNRSSSRASRADGRRVWRSAGHLRRRSDP